MAPLFQENKLSFGVGLRHQHFKYFTKKIKGVDALEIHPENFFGKGIEHYYLEQISEIYDISFHGIGLSLGSEEKVDKSHLKKIRNLMKKYKPFIYSEHMSWMKVDGIFFHDLLPLDYTKKRLHYLKRNIEDTQNYLGQNICIENPSYYLKIIGDMEEYDFLNELCRLTGCEILLDINNLYINSVNHNFNPMEYIDRLDSKFIKEVHLAGHSFQTIDDRKIIIDTHDDFVRQEVWDLYKYYINKANTSFFTIIEWDQELPKEKELISELIKAKYMVNRYA